MYGEWSEGLMSNEVEASAEAEREMLGLVGDGKSNDTDPHRGIGGSSLSTRRNGDEPVPSFACDDRPAGMRTMG